MANQINRDKTITWTERPDLSEDFGRGIYLTPNREGWHKHSANPDMWYVAPVPIPRGLHAHIYFKGTASSPHLARDLTGYRKYGFRYTQTQETSRTSTQTTSTRMMKWS